MSLLVDLDIYERDAYQRAGIELLNPVIDLLAQERVRAISFPRGRGIARLLNLLQWEADGGLEFIDGQGTHADQLIHLGLHRLCDHKLGSADPGAMLYAECLASASDIYLLGKLSLAGEETDFLADTLESFSSYYELYSHHESHLEQLLSQLQNNPYTTMLAVADYLFQFCLCLLYPTNIEAVGRELETMADHVYQPLVHHYNTANWILTIRSKHPHPPELPIDLCLSAIRAQLAQGEDALLSLMRSCIDQIS